MSFNIGDTVNFHSLIGGPVTSTGHEITHIVYQPNNFGCDVAWISNKSGCVALAALSNDKNPMKPPTPKSTRSKKRYAAYLHSETSESFIEWLQNSYWDDYRKRFRCA